MSTLNLWTWPSPGCDYLLSTSIGAHIELNKAIVFNRATHVYDVREPSEIKISGGAPDAHDALQDPACGTATFNIAGTMSVAVGSYPEPLRWKGRIAFSRVGSAQNANVDIEFALMVNPVPPSTFDSSVVVGGSNVANSFDLLTSMALSPSSNVQLDVGDKLTHSLLSRPSP